MEGEPRDVGTVPGRADSYAPPEDLESGKCSGSTFGQSARKRHEHYQSDDRDDDQHDHNPGIAEALSPYHQRGGNIALARTQRKNPPRVIARSSEQPSGEYRCRSLDSEGFILCSTPDQVVEVANYLFRGQRGLVLLVIDPESVVPEYPIRGRGQR